jgi:hypothetical protein
MKQTLILLVTLLSAPILSAADAELPRLFSATRGSEKNGRKPVIHRGQVVRYEKVEKVDPDQEARLAKQESLRVLCKAHNGAVRKKEDLVNAPKAGTIPLAQVTTALAYLTSHTHHSKKEIAAIKQTLAAWNVDFDHPGAELKKVLLTSAAKAETGRTDYSTHGFGYQIKEQR